MDAGADQVHLLLFWNDLYDDRLVGVQFLGCHLVGRQEDVTVAVATVARFRLWSFQLDVVGRSMSPGRFSIEVGHQIIA